MSSSEVASSIRGVASILVVLLVVAGLFALAPSARADKILYERITKKQGERWWVIRPGGRHARRLPQFGLSQWPDLTADGRRLVFINLLGGGGLLTSPFAHRRLRAVRGSPSFPWYPRWSPSGKRIAAAAEVEPPSGWPENSNFSQVFVIRPGGGRPRRLRTPVSMRFQSWSPDGRRIVAGGGRSQTVCTGLVCETTFSSGLWVINVATGAAREIVHFDNEVLSAPAWSPNGRTIAVSRSTQETAHVWTVRPNGTGLRQLTPLPVVGYQPSWSPDGRRLAVTIQRRSRGRDIATIRADGSGLRVLTHSGDNFNPDWAR